MNRKRFIVKPTLKPIMIYTFEETRKKRYTVQQAVDSANFILSEQGIKKADLSSLAGIKEDQKFTLVEINSMTDKIVKDTRFNRR
jgi:hypothetical protein